MKRPPNAKPTLSATTRPVSVTVLKNIPATSSRNGVMLWKTSLVAKNNRRYIYYY